MALFVVHTWKNKFNTFQTYFYFPFKNTKQAELLSILWCTFAKAVFEP